MRTIEIKSQDKLNNKGRRYFAFILLAISLIVAAPIGAYATKQCNDGIDNDQDGKTDILYAPDPATAPHKVWFKDPFGIRDFVNSKALERGFKQIGADSALNFDTTTAQFVCNLAGYANVASMDCVSIYDGGRCGWYSQHDNYLDNWDSNTRNFTTRKARDAGNKWISSLTCKNKIPTCGDGKDNDGDGRIDFPADNGCANAWDDSEVPHDPDCSASNNDFDSEKPPHLQCNDGVDNDGDGAVDFGADFSCSSPTDNDENLPKAQCQDGIDNDGDGATDFGSDFSCTSKQDNDETNQKSQCQDGIDNDGDGLLDFGSDPGCSSRQDNSESSATTQCQDGIDNDGDGATDYASDFSCTSKQDDDETFPKAECQDGIDNDSDGLADLLDPGCFNKQDNSENSATSQCQDGVDNDSDGATDFGSDFSCSSKIDNDESNPKSHCQDGQDNDGDGLVDLNDPGCSTNQDNNEADGSTQCQDGFDNDGDGLIDFGNDPGCESRQDLTEQDQLGLLSPIAECIDRLSSGIYIAHFGYRNESSAAITVAIGSFNQFTSAPAERGQPTALQSGRVINAFTVEFNGQPLTWRLGLASATVSQSTQLCTDTPSIVPPTCLESDVTALLISLDSGARRQRDLVLKSGKTLRKYDTKSATFVKKANSLAEQLYKSAWSTTWAVPRLITSCDNTSQCVKIDNAPTVLAYNDASVQLKSLADGVASKLAKLKRNAKAKKAATSTKLSSQTLHETNLKNSSAVPRFDDQC